MRIPLENVDTFKINVILKILNLFILARLAEVSETEGFKHLLKYSTKRLKDNEYYYPFAQHPRFKFWAYDRIRRHRSLAQSKIYLDKCSGDANLSINDLKAMLRVSDDSASNLMKRMCTYSANITGSDAFWHKQRTALEAIFEQVILKTKK